MSIARQFLREFRPLIRMLEEPLGRQVAATSAIPRYASNPFALLNDPFFAQGPSLPAVDVHEDGNQYVVEAELPGLKKENIDLRIGDNGQSLTIEGRTFVKSAPEEAPKAEAQTTDAGVAPTEGTQTVAKTTNGPTALSTERQFTGASAFSRTIWLPRRVDGSKVSAKLADGVLTVRVPKAEDSESVKVNIE